MIDVPQQGADGSACGLFLLQYAEQLGKENGNYFFFSLSFFLDILQSKNKQKKMTMTQ